MDDLGRRLAITGCALLAGAAVVTAGVAGASPQVSAAKSKSCGKVLARGGGAKTQVTIVKGSVTCKKAKSTILFILDQSASKPASPKGWMCTQGPVTKGFVIKCARPGTVVTGRQKF